MNENSIFNKINKVKEQQVESNNSDKEKMYEEVRKENEEFRNKKQELLDLYEKIKSQKDKTSIDHKVYKEVLEKILPVFENEESKKILAEQGVESVNNLLNKHSDTSEAQDLDKSDLSVKEGIQNLKNMKQEVINLLNIKNPDYKSLRGVMSALQSKADSMDGEIFSNSADIPEGRESWPLSYPTGAFHKESGFEKNIKENKEGKLREIYHNLGDKIDSALLESAEEYNKSNSGDPLKMDKDYKEGRHILGRGSIGVDENGIKFFYGSGGYSTIHYEIKSKSDGKLFLYRKESFKALLPEKYLEIFNKKLNEIDSNFGSTAESI